MRGSTTTSLFRWLSFRQSAAQANPSAQTANTYGGLSVSHSLKEWEQNSHRVQPSGAILQLATALFIVLGASAMAGVLHAAEVINIWLPLGLFAFLPLLLTLVSVHTAVFSSNHLALRGHPWLMWWFERLQLQVLSPYQELLVPWLYYQLQRLGLVFAGAALVTFFVLATFQDYRFHWSSTLITDPNTMSQLIHTIGWPWHTVIPLPSTDVIAESRNQAFTTGHEAGNHWWPFMVMSISVYGIAPRLLLTLFLRQRLRRQLVNAITNSSAVEQFMVQQQRQSSQAPIDSENELTPLNTVRLPVDKADLVSWQQVDIGLSVIKNLGTDDWSQDQQWMAQYTTQRRQPLWVLINPMHTPTGELADCLEALHHPDYPLQLVLYPFPKDDSGLQNRLTLQIKSWQFFAQQHQLALVKGVSHAQ